MSIESQSTRGAPSGSAAEVRLAGRGAAYPAQVADDVHLFHITCGGCAAGWAGDDRAHCGRCHVTFDSLALYDGHRAGGRCVRPQVLGLVSTKNGIWRDPERRTVR
jgi:hypothetical protein